MRKTALILTFCAGLAAIPAAAAQTAIGQWRDCLDFSEVYQVQVGGNDVYAAAGGGVIHYDRSSAEMDLLSKSTGASDVGVSTIGYDAESQSLVIAYKNSNIDIVQEGTVYNVSDIKRSELLGDKSINCISFNQGMAYLGTGFGVVALDLDRHEIKETYRIGTGGSGLPVYSLAFTPDSIYAATLEGLKRVSANERYLGISDRWTLDLRLQEEEIRNLSVFNGRLLLLTAADTLEQRRLYAQTDSGYTVIDTGNIHSVRPGGGMLCISHWDYIIRRDTALLTVDSLFEYDWWAGITAYDAVMDDDGAVWLAHPWIGLCCTQVETPFFLSPEGPHAGDNVYRLSPTPRRMLLCPGGHTTTYANSYLSPNLFTASGSKWESLDKSNGRLDGLTDVIDAAYNPTDTAEIIVALWGHGVASVRDNAVQTLYNHQNTGGVLRQYTVGDYSTLLTGAVCFDRQGNLWVLNSHSSAAIVQRTADGRWIAHSTSALSSRLQVDKMIFDSVNHYIWFAGRDNAIYVHDGDNRCAKINPNNGSKLQTESVTALAQDQNGNIWIGTNRGIKVIYDGYRAFANGGNGQTAPVLCNNITITNGDFYEYLMAYENITCIAVDGANRKWVGTATGGLYLLSANGMEQIEHFSSDNSPLFSDNIISVAVQPYSGEVYIGTDRGVQVFRGTATYAEEEPSAEIYAFPNPVRPEYEGVVAIKGFTRNALVHITDAAGHVVCSTRALGGQAIWDVCTAAGEPVRSGVYYVFASDNEGGNRSVAKILVIR